MAARNGNCCSNVELPLALPSIMTGINQTILMSLSMVVIASLIGAEGLGALILEALQYAAKGQGLLGGLAILVSAPWSSTGSRKACTAARLAGTKLTPPDCPGAPLAAGVLFSDPETDAVHG